MKRVAKVVALVAWYGLMGELGLWALIDTGAGKWYAIGACLFMVGIDTLVRSRPTIRRRVDRRIANVYAMSSVDYTPPPVRFGDARLPLSASDTVIYLRQSGGWYRQDMDETRELPLVPAHTCQDVR